MGPVSLVGQLNRSMNAGNPVLDQVSNSAPTFDPSSQPPAQAPMPDKSPMSAMHPALESAFKRRGLSVPAQLQQSQAPQLQAASQPTQNPTEAELIVKAIDRLAGTFAKRLEMLSGHEERIRDTVLPKQEQK